MGKIEDAMSDNIILKHSEHVISEDEFLATKEPGFKEEMVKRIKAGEDMNKRAFFDTTQYKIHRVGILIARPSLPDPDSCSPAEALIGMLMVASGAASKMQIHVMMTLLEPRNPKERWCMRLSLSGGDEERRFREYTFKGNDKRVNMETFDELLEDTKKEFFELRGMELSEEKLLVLSGDETHEEFTDKLLSTGCFNITSFSHESSKRQAGK